MNWRFLQRAPTDKGVLAPPPALVLARNALGSLAVTAGVFAVLAEVLPPLYSEFPAPSILPYKAFLATLWIIAAATLVNLPLRLPLVRAVLVAIVGMLASVSAFVLAWPWEELPLQLLLMISGMATLVTFNARQFAELLLCRLRGSAWHGVQIILATSLLLILQHAHEIKQLRSWFLPFAAACFASLLTIAPLLIDKRRVRPPPDRGAMLLWIAWNLSALYQHLNWQSYVVAAGNCLVATLLIHFAWRNSRPQPPLPANPVTV
jgi:hypothetical protein